MSKYVINYNPYKNETTVEKDGSQLKKNSYICKGLSGKRLQTWFDETADWPGLGKVLDDDNNESTCKIFFKGREIDFIDLKDYFEKAYKSAKNTEFILNAENLSSDDDMLFKLSKLVEQARNEKLFPENQIIDIEQHINSLKNDPFVISVIAPMSSGKSTLLNAIMHRDLLPTGDEGTTANIVEIFDDDSELIKYQTFDKNGDTIDQEKEADNNTIISVNADKNVRTVKIHTDIPMVSARRMPLMLRDTPGPNNSDDITHRQITESIISNARNMSTVLFVLNATQPRTDSENDLLSRIAAEMKSGGKQANDRFLFVINRVDDWIKKPHQTLEGLVNRTKEYLLQLGIDNPRIFPVTASLACNIWKERNGYEFDLIEKNDYSGTLELFKNDIPQVLFNEYSSVSSCVARLISEDLARAKEENNTTEIALIHSGLKGLEYSIKEYMEKYAYPIKVSDAIEDIIASIDDKKMRAQYQIAIATDHEKLEKAKKKLKENKEKKTERVERIKVFIKGLDEYSISSEIKNEASQFVIDAFSDLIDEKTTQIKNKDKLKQDDAREIVADLQQKIRNKEEELDVRIKELLEEEIYKKGNAILYDFQSYVQKVEEEIAIDDFNFKKVKELKKTSFDDIKKVSEEVTSTEQLYKREEKTVRNPNYRKFLFWHWGGDKYKTEIINTPTGTVKYIDRDKFIEDLIGIRVNADNNVEAILKEGSDLIDAFKQFFVIQIGNFSKTIDAITEQLEVDTNKVELEKGNLKIHQTQLEALDRYMKQINDITEL